MNTDAMLTWLENEMKEREWNDNDLAKRMPVSRSLISHIRHHRRSLTADFIIDAAKTLDADPVSVLVMAGILPPQPEPDTPLERDLLLAFRRLDAEAQRVVVRMVQGAGE